MLCDKARDTVHVAMEEGPDADLDVEKVFEMLNAATSASDVVASILRQARNLLLSMPNIHTDAADAVEEQLINATHRFKHLVTLVGDAYELLLARLIRDRRV